MAVIVILSAIMALALGQRPAVLPQLVKEELTTASPLVFNGTYWLAMSNKIRPGIPFQISAQLLDGQSPVQVTVIIKDQKGVQTILQDAFTVNSGDVETFGIDIPLDIQPPAEMDDRYWYQPYYQVHVKGEGQDIYFKHSTQVQFEQKAFSTFIQTDKGMYKPGQKVMFRVLTVFPDMKAVRGEPYDIYIKDSDDNRIRQWLGVQDPNGRGVIELWLQLADEIPTGDWTIVASIMRKEETKTFTVDDYVLPRFEVEVQLPSFALAYDQLLKIRVKATYTFGQPVSDGAVKIAIKSVYQWAKDEVLYKKGKLSKDGTLTIEVAHKEIMSMLRENYQFLSSLNSQRIKVEAEVTESQTGRMQNSSSIVQFFDTPMKLRFVEEVAPDHFKPGLPYTIYTEVRKQDDTRFPEDVSKLMKIYFNVTYEIPLTEEELAEQREQQNSNSGTSSSSSSSGKLVADIEPGIPGRYYYPRTKTMMLHLDEAQRVQSVPANGWITLSFDTPREATQVTIEAWSTKPYKELRTSKWLSRAVSPSDSFLHLQVGTEKPTAGAEFTVTAISTDVIPMLTYQIFSKGALLQTTVVPAPPGNSSSVDFSFMVTRNMTPSISLVAFYVREENQEVVVDALSLSVNGLFQNPITVEFTQQEAEPGDKVEVIVKAAADSLVYLLSADKSAILLKGGNDLTQDDVAKDMAAYTLGGGFGPWEFMFICGWPSFFHGSDASSVLQNAGVIFLSDAWVYADRWSNSNRYPVVDMGGDAGLGAIEESAKPTGKQEFTAAEVVRKFFPEVWLWEISYITDDSGGQVSIPATVPDTLTTWITTGFSLHPEFGLSITEKPTELVVSKPMFVTLDLPMTIIRGENYCFTATIFSYYDYTIPIMVTLDKSSKFSNIHVGIDQRKVKLTTENAYYSSYLGDVLKDETRSVKYCFVPTELGEIPVRVSALTNVQGLSDAVERVIVCKPEGVPRASSIASIADLSGNGTWTKSVDIDFPSETVNGSEKLEVSASGNFLASVFDNLEDLMKRPYGCGEQNMLNFAPNIFLLEFYLRTDTLTNALKTKAVTYMLAGYQKENKYRHKDGGFSAFGSRDPQASTWLTAFVVKCYALAQQLYLQNDDLLAIDSNIMEESLKFLTVRQKRDGSFYENGTVFHKEMQGASAEEGVSLTAYTLIAMYEAQQVFREGNDTLSMKILDHIESSMDRATAYLTTKLSTLTDSYDICVTTYALTLVDAPAKETAFIMMQNKAIVNAHGKHWERPKPQKEERYHWSATTDSINIEMTAYALLVYSLRPDAVSNGFPVLKWLTKNKGPNAGFYSTQDTIIGLQALSRVGSELYTGEDIPMNVTITYVDPNGMDEMHVFDLDKSNEMLLQIARINYMNNNPKVLDIKVQTRSGEKGPTNAVVETTLRYNIMEKVRTNRYILDFTQTQTKARFILDISIKAPHGEKRSMSILAVELAAGYFPDLESLGDNIFISLAEVREDTLYVYFDTDVIDSEGVEVRAIFQVKPSGALTKPKPRFIRVYDFYEPQYEASQTYTLKQVGDDEFCSNVGDVGVCAILHSQSTMN